ncbi:MAG: hypothetical protein U0U66_03935 [Cytophagaceae bacterium]
MGTFKGKMYWVADDFNYYGFYVPKTDDTFHVVANIQNVIISEFMIKFDTTPVEYFGKNITYNVNLKANDIGLGFSGKFFSPEDEGDGEVYCEVFENNKTYFLFGRWIENEIITTWWARIEKNSINL